MQGEFDQEKIRQKLDGGAKRCHIHVKLSDHLISNESSFLALRIKGHAKVPNNFISMFSFNPNRPMRYMLSIPILQMRKLRLTGDKQ